MIQNMDRDRALKEVQNIHFRTTGILELIDSMTKRLVNLDFQGANKAIREIEQHAIRIGSSITRLGACDRCVEFKCPGDEVCGNYDKPTDRNGDAP